MKFREMIENLVKVEKVPALEKSIYWNLFIVISIKLVKEYIDLIIYL